MNKADANGPEDTEAPLHDRALLLHGRLRNEVLTLSEVQRYGSDSFSDPDYVRLYGMTPPQWYARGIRLLGRTARLKPITLESVKLRARRPKYSALSNARLAAAGVTMPDWRDALRRALESQVST